jgi:hypothetical protein
VRSPCTRTGPSRRFEISGEISSYDGRGFCPRCGSRLLDTADPDDTFIEIRIGSLGEAPFELKPGDEIWVKRRESWIPPVAGADGTSVWRKLPRCLLKHSPSGGEGRTRVRPRVRPSRHRKPVERALVRLKPLQMQHSCCSKRPSPYPRFSTDNTIRGFARLFKPSDGLEPSTPSLPWSSEAGHKGKREKPRARKSRKPTGSA